jgi:hypothetical protein
VIYLSGLVRPDLEGIGIGFMRTPTSHHGKMPLSSIWAADSGRYANPASYSDDNYLAWLTRRRRDLAKCLFATAPDVVGDHAATVKMSTPMLSRIGVLGYRVAFVAQDGWRDDDTPWQAFDVLFVGGTTSFKFRGGRDAVRAAKRRGKWVHMGRVNSLDRLRGAIGIGCDSADGTFLKFGPDKNLPQLLRWLHSTTTQLEMVE